MQHFLKNNTNKKCLTQVDSILVYDIKKHLQNSIGLTDPSVFNALISVWEMKQIFGRGVWGSNGYVCWFSINAIFVRKPARFGKADGKNTV